MEHPQRRERILRALHGVRRGGSDSVADSFPHTALNFSPAPRAAPLPARDGVPGRLAVHVNLHVERYDSSDDDDDDEAAPVAAVAAPV